MVSILGQILFLASYLGLLLLITRLVMSLVMQYGRRWRPGRTAAASLEVVWSVTDPPLHALRRVIPPLRIGTVSLDIAFIVLFVILYLLMTVVANQLI